MQGRQLKISIVLIALRFLLHAPNLAVAQVVRPVTSQELSAAIAQLRSGEHEVERNANRDDAGQHLARLIRLSKPDQIHDETISEIESLLDSPDDYIRAYAACSR